MTLFQFQCSWRRLPKYIRWRSGSFWARCSTILTTDWRRIAIHAPTKHCSFGYQGNFQDFFNQCVLWKTSTLKFHRYIYTCTYCYSYKIQIQNTYNVKFIRITAESLLNSILGWSIKLKRQDESKAIIRGFVLWYANPISWLIGNSRPQSENQI